MDDWSPTISIVTIAFNDLKGLKRTIDSVNCQSIENWEHIVVDGGSTDGTAEWLRQTSQDPRRRWKSEKDKGIYDAMNKGLSESSGDLVMVLNSADVLSSQDSLAIVVESYLAHGWRWAYGSLRLTSTDGDVIGAYSFDPFHPRKFFMGLAWIPHGATIMSRGLIEELGNYRLDLGSVSDQEYLMRAVGVCHPKVITWYLSDFAVGGVSQSQSSRSRELLWHEMRLLTGNLWKSRHLDRCISEILALRAPVRKALRKVGGDR